MDVNKWINALKEPVETFRDEKKNANLEKAVINVGGSGAVVGVIQGFIILLFGATVEIPPDFRTTAMVVAMVIMIMTPISAIISLLIASGIWFVIARLLGGKGNYVEQTYLYSLIYAPVIVINAVLWTPLFIIGFFHRGFPSLLVGSVLVYTCVLPFVLYLLTMALKEVHGYSTIKAVLTWLIPVIIILVGWYYILLRLYDDPYY